MAAQNEPATGMDFWAAIGVGQEEDDGPEEQPSQDKLLVTGAPAPAAPADTGTATSPETGAGQQSPQDDWASLFSAWDDSANGAAPASGQPSAGAPSGQAAAGAGGAQAQAPAPAPAPKPEAQEQSWNQEPAKPANAPSEQPPKDPEVVPGADAPEVGGAEQAAPSAQDHRITRSTPFGTGGQAAQTAAPAQPAQAAQPEQATQPAQPEQPANEPVEAAAAQPPPAADPAWATAERIATTLRPRVAELWLEVLTRHTGGDPAMASRVYHVLNGTHLLGELMRDETIDEVHVHGTQVTVCGARGIRQIPGFPNLAASRRAVKTITASREKRGLVVSKVNDSVVISRREGVVPKTNALVASGVVSGDQLARIRQALQQMQAVTVTGPAARIVLRALASLIPEGSRVFLGAYATLPPGCVTAVSPMEADYVLGVRPGAVAEEMAGAGQVGALIANPETRLAAALRFAVTGPSAAPERLVER
ncbi:hypothetical protein GCM10010402_04030 [Actinomadura luteofluorescens]|uniref:hypothetical protein n=1 Tax=Actinomadura luteofluorescens TaxID=46163 RepID=UPI0021649E1B|nr:hypothetical protein [Actinomadura glauciflava]MCR3745925.1 hypothetical protein [Actinomadura glauciflava]